MKKIFTKIALLALGLTAFVNTAKAQLPDGSIAPDFTAKDISGNTWNLYTYLNQGKTVYIDIFATWCSPCWQFHHDKCLDSLWQQHGPTGMTGVNANTTNDVMIFMVEGDTGTNTGCISNSGCNTGYAPTQGNWASGTNYPILDKAYIANLYQITYFPTVYAICPDRTIRNVSPSNVASPYLPFYYGLHNSCILASPNLDAGVLTTQTQYLMSCDSVTPSINITNYSTNALTACTVKISVDGVVQKTINWAGSLSSYNVANINNVKISAAATGIHNVTVSVSGPNGGTDANASNDQIQNITFHKLNSVGGSLITEGFESTSSLPATWFSYNVGLVDPADSAYAWQQSTSGGYGTSGKGAWVDFFDGPSGEIYNMVLAPQSFATAGSNLKMTFDISKGTFDSTETNDGLLIKVSADCGQTWTTVYQKYDQRYNAGDQVLWTVYNADGNNLFVPTASQWRTDTVQLGAFAGQGNVYIKFEGVSNYGDALYIDNINISNSVAGIKTVNNITHVNLYPNPATSQSTLDVSLAVAEDNVAVTVFNNLGQIVYNENKVNMPAGDNQIILNTQNFASGIYNVNISTANGFITRKLSIVK